MFNEERENVLIERLVRRQEKANEQILKELGKVLGEIGQLTPSEAYTIGQQLKYGESLQKIVRILSETSRLTEVEIYEMLRGEARYNLDFSKKYFKARQIDFAGNVTAKIKQFRIVSRSEELSGILLSVSAVFCPVRRICRCHQLHTPHSTLHTSRS